MKGADGIRAVWSEGERSWEENCGCYGGGAEEGCRTRKGVGEGRIRRNWSEKKASPVEHSAVGVCVEESLGLTHVTLRGHRQSPGFKVRAMGGGMLGGGYGVSRVTVAALTEAVGAVKRRETKQVGVVVRGFGERWIKSGPSEQGEGCGG